MKFSPGRVVWTRYINDCVDENTKFAKFVTDSLARHCMGDWGEISESDKRKMISVLISTCGYFLSTKKVNS